MTLSIESMDERLLGRYPRHANLRDGLPVTITPVVPSDWHALEHFMRDIPEPDRQFFRRELTDSARVERWCSQLDYDQVLPLVAWDEDRIVADIALMRDPDLWTSHIGKVRMLIHPHYRGRGVGQLMLREAITVAKTFGLHRVVHECAGPQVELISFLEREGFTEAARLKGFVKGADDSTHDLILMVL